MRLAQGMTILAAFAMFCLTSAVALACGADSRCNVDGGYYLAAEPPDWDGTSPLPVMVYFHGWNGSPEGTFRNKAMVDGVNRRGALFVAPFARTGYWRQIGADRAEGGRDELAFIRAVMADIHTRWPVDKERVMSSGFSRGASMSWNVACYAGDLFAAHAPIAGGFWGSTPETCPTGPVTMRHIHGLSDGVVAYDEVGIYNSMPIPDGMAMLRRLNGADDLVDHSYQIDHPKRPLDCTRYEGRSGDVLETCLHPRGHSIPAEWVADGLDWLESLKR
jgi:polyhydroxybutyrate depolymerase